MTAVAVSNLAFESLLVRVIDREGEPWFVASDVCRALDVQNPSSAVKILEDDEKAKFFLGSGSEGNIISESGLYTLMMRCRDALKPDTLPYRFRRWMTRDVLPAIRTTGGYSLTRDPQPYLAPETPRRSGDAARQAGDCA